LGAELDADAPCDEVAADGPNGFGTRGCAAPKGFGGAAPEEEVGGTDGLA
jgi:hypothetical protein